MTVGGTIVAGNTVNGSLQNCYGPAPNDGGYNLTDDTTCGFSTANHDIIETTTAAVGLDPTGLQNSGGPTQTIALLPTSPAIDRIPLGTSFTANATTFDLCPANGTDQRGYPRPDQNEAYCDIGAYEYQDAQFPTPNGQDAYDIESSNFSCPAGGTMCVGSNTYASQCLTTAPCPGINYGDVEAFGPPNNSTSGIPDEMVLACVYGTNTGYQIGYLDVVSNQGNTDYQGGVYGNADSGVISGKGTLIGGGGAEDNPSQPSSVTASVYDASTGIIGSVSGIQNTDNGSNTLNSGQFRVTIRGRLWTVNLMGTSPVFTQSATSSTMSCTVGGSHANDLKNAGLDTVSLAEGELEPSLGDNFFLQSVAPDP